MNSLLKKGMARHTVRRHLTSFVTCAMFNINPYSILLVSKVCPMLKYSDIYDL